MALQCSVLAIVLFLRMCSFFFVFLFQGITFDEFRSFFQFLNNLEDFAIAMQMYNFASRSIGQGERRVVADAIRRPERPPTLSLDRWPSDRICGLTHQTSLRERCTWPLGWSWHVTSCTPSSRSSMWITMTSCPTRSSSESWRTGCTEEPGWETADCTVDVYKMGLGVKIRGFCFRGGRWFTTPNGKEELQVFYCYMLI